MVWHTVLSTEPPPTQPLQSALNMGRWQELSTFRTSLSRKLLQRNLDDMLEKEETQHPPESSASNTSRPEHEPTETDARSVPESGTIPDDLNVEKRVRSVDDTDDYLKTRARLLELTGRPVQHVSEKTDSWRSDQTGGKECDSKVRVSVIHQANIMNFENNKNALFSSGQIPKSILTCMHTV